MTDPPQIHAGLCHSHDGHLSRTLESAQCMEAGRQMSPAEIETSDGQKILVGYDSYSVSVLLFFWTEKCEV